MNRVKYIIQARMGSSRLPGKMTLPFFDGKGIFELLLKRITEIVPREDVILATTDSKKDDELVELALMQNVSVFRGSEEDVLKRFIGAAEKSKADIVVRICADNPFLDVESIQPLVKAHSRSKADYTAYRTGNGTPSILTHFGFWAEVVALSALKKASMTTQDKLYREHVTNYVYKHPQDFTLHWETLPDVFTQNESRIRFTIDTAGDFERLKPLYKSWIETEMTAESAIAIAIDNEEIVSEMHSEIKDQSKA